MIQNQLAFLLKGPSLLLNSKHDVSKLENSMESFLWDSLNYFLGGTGNVLSKLKKVS
jgi:hypothetical protein